MGCVHNPVPWQDECDKCEIARLRAELAAAQCDAADVGLYLTRRLAAAERERDERPAISRHDARMVWGVTLYPIDGRDDDEAQEAVERLRLALMDHAGPVTCQCSTNRAACLLHGPRRWESDDGARGRAADAAPRAPQSDELESIRALCAEAACTDPGPDVADRTLCMVEELRQRGVCLRDHAAEKTESTP